MKKILILGASGMLGSAVSFRLSTEKEYITTSTYRAPVSGAGSLVFDALTTPPDKLGGPYDYVINCIGIIKPFMQNNTPGAIRINSLFPWELSDWCAKTGAKLIHITTDCVYSGKKGKYVESDHHDALDDYGKSKSLGECSGAMVLRTSIIGEELHKFASLISWAKSQKGKITDGFTTHLWNGVTTKQYAEVCRKIIDDGLYEEGVFHIFARDDVSKYDLLQAISDRFSLNLFIRKASPEAIDRTLRTEKDLCAKLGIPTVREMIRNM